MNIQRKNSAHHFRMQSEREQYLYQLSTVHVVHVCMCVCACVCGVCGVWNRRKGV